MKRFLALLIVLALLAGGGYLLYAKAGFTPRFLVEHRARTEQRVPEHWTCLSQKSDNAQALLFYDPETRQHIFSVYEKQSLGFTFARGGSSDMLLRGILRVPIHIDGACAYLSMNAPGAARVTMSGMEDQTLDPQQPFVVILPPPVKDVAFLDAQGGPIPVNFHQSGHSPAPEN